MGCLTHEPYRRRLHVRPRRRVVMGTPMEESNMPMNRTRIPQSAKPMERVVNHPSRVACRVTLRSEPQHGLLHGRADEDTSAAASCMGRPVCACHSGRVADEQRSTSSYHTAAEDRCAEG